MVVRDDAGPDVSAIVLAYGTEPYLVPCVDALLASEGVVPEVVLVDNGCTDGSVELLAGRRDPRLVIRHPGRNLGYAAGCNEGASVARAPVLAFVNYDAIVDPLALFHLVEATRDESVGLATASIRLAEEPTLLNSAGNDIHYLGLSWSGRFREPADRYPVAQEVTGASGAGMACSQAVWRRLGGFEPTFFMYHDDAELSMRCLLQGLTVSYVPQAVIRHRYEFSRNPRKLYLIERNRLIMVLTTFQARTLALVGPALLVVELAMLALAVREGWGKAKVDSWKWLFAHGEFLLERRRRIQRERRVADRALVPRLVSRIDPGNYELTPAVALLNVFLGAYWRVVRRVI
jgi:GT2 family glycosyltransferase